MSHSCNWDDIIRAKSVPALMPSPGSEDENGLPASASRGALGRARAIANRAFAETVVVKPNGHGNGHRAEAASATRSPPTSAVRPPPG